MKGYFNQLPLSLQTEVGFFLLIPMDHPVDIYSGSAEEAESGSAGVQWSHHVLEQEDSVSQSSFAARNTVLWSSTSSSLQQPLPRGDSHLCPGFPQLWE